MYIDEKCLHKHKKTDKNLLPLEEKIKGCIDNLSALEKEECDSIDMVANTFGELLGAVASFGLDKENELIGYEVGFHLGKWVYVIDACDDFEKDKKTDSYNPLRLAFGDTLGENERLLLQNAMMLELDKMSRAVELIDFSQHTDVEAIIKNIIYDGLVSETKRVLGLDKKEEKR